jgi:Uma2 family endonuclease
MNPTGIGHEDIARWLNRYFVRDAGLEVKVEQTFLTPDGFVVPDFQVAPDLPRRELSRSAPLVVEIAQSSHRRDREKVAVYARADVPEYWIVDVLEELVIVHRDPSGGAYATVTEHREGMLQPSLAAPPLALDALFDRR